MRTIDSAALAELSGAVVSGALLLQIDSSPVLRLTPAAVDIVHGGNTYTGVGQLGTVETVVDSTGAEQTLRFQLSAVDSSLLALALQDSMRGAAVTLRFSILSSTTHAVLDAPQVFAGFVDQTPIVLDQTGDAATFAAQATALHRGVTAARAKPLRNTDADQQKLVPGDTSRRFVVSQSQHKDVWPSAAFLRR